MAQRFLYLRDYSKGNKQPIGCLTMELNRAANEICYAFSVCSPSDTFNPDVARDIAKGRLKKCPVLITGDIPATGHEITKRVMKHIAETNSEQSSSHTRSQLAYQAANGWLLHTACPTN